MTKHDKAISNLAIATENAKRFPESEHMQALREKAFKEYLVVIQSTPAPIPTTTKRKQIASVVLDSIALSAGLATVVAIAIILSAFDV